MAGEAPGGLLTVGRFRDATGINRNAVMPVLEFFDRTGFTTRRAALVTPRLTTIASPRFEIGRLGAEKLLAAIAARPSTARRLDVGFELVVGDST